MDSLNVTVPPEQQAVVDSWQDGEEYTIKVRQTGAGTFDLVSTEPDAEDATDATDEPSDADMAKNPNPAIAIVMAKKAK